MGRQPVINSFCVACGSRNVVQHSTKVRKTDPPQRLVRCRACGVVSVDFNERKPREGVRHGFEQLDKATAISMTDQILSACTNAAVRKSMQEALAASHGDVALICHTYLPIVLDVFVRVIEPFGFTPSLEGVMASIEVLQKFARDDLDVVRRLIAIRQLLTPTGDWIREDQQADELERRRQEEERLEQQRIEQNNRLAAEAVARNAALARLRAKKLALGLDPSLARLPLVLQVPSPLIAAREGDCIRLQVNVRFSLRRQWFFNGKPLDDSAEDIATQRRGVKSCTLVLPKMSKRVEGEYFCLFENEEGNAVTPVTRVELVEKLRAERIETQKLGSASIQAAPLIVKVGQSDTYRQAVACCITSNSFARPENRSASIAILSIETLAFLKLTPPIAIHSNKALVAWADIPQTLAVLTTVPTSATSNIQKKKDRSLQKANKPMKQTAAYAISLYSLSGSGGAEAVSPARSPNARAPSIRSITRSNSAINAIETSPSSIPVIPKLIASRNISSPETFQDGLRTMTFLDSGKLLALSDLLYSVVIYSIDCSTNAFHLVHTFKVSNRECLCHIAASPESSVLGVAYRRMPVLDILRINTTDFSVSIRRHNFALPVHCLAIDCSGLFVAVAESAGCLKSWIAIANLNTNDPESMARKEPMRSKRRFEAHVGGISSLQWTKTSSLLLSSGLDGFVKIWNIASVGASLLAEFHMDSSVLQMAYSWESSTLVTVVNPRRLRTASSEDKKRQCVIQGHVLRHLRELEVFRSEQQGRAAAQVQKLWKGRHTRALLEQLLGENHWRNRRRQSSVISSEQSANE